MIKRIAKAMAIANGETFDIDIKPYLEMARTAVDVMEEPTEGLGVSLFAVQQI